MTTLIVAEKPSVARDLGEVLGARSRRGGYLEGSGYQVTWAVGHLVELAQPGQIDERWCKWDVQHLPMLPEAFPLSVREGLGKQFKVVKSLLGSRATQLVICATDAGREGELIFRYLYELAGAKRPVRRLWISSLTPEAIRAGLAALRPARDFDGLAAAARARSQADWLVGMNLTRAYSLASGELYSVGRVQTPTLALIVARDLAIDGFEAEPYREVEATFATEAGELKASYVLRVFDDQDGAKPKDVARLPPMAVPPTILGLDEDADAIAARATEGLATLREVRLREQVERPPLLFDLTELQRTANRLWGFSAARTLELAQELYEQHKVLTYPRTDSRHLSRDVAASLEPVLANIRWRYAALLSPETGQAKLGPRFVDDSKVTDHHAIIPTAIEPARLTEGSDAFKVYDLVCRRLLSAWQPDFIEAVTEIDVAISTGGLLDRYQARGRAVVRQGWRVLELRESDSAGAPHLPAGLATGMTASCLGARIVDKQTRPPPRYTEATLLRAMETAGAALGGELSEAMRERGLGTPATRASTIETLLSRGYMVRKTKALESTPSGRALVARVHPHVRSPQLTGEWEARLRKIERGQDSAERFAADVRAFVVYAVGDALEHGVAPRRGAEIDRGAREPIGRGHRAGSLLQEGSPMRTTRARLPR